MSSSSLRSLPPAEVALLFLRRKSHVLGEGSLGEWMLNCKRFSWAKENRLICQPLSTLHSNLPPPGSFGNLEDSTNLVIYYDHVLNMNWKIGTDLNTNF